MYGYIYKTTDLTNNKIYVGQHKSNEFDNTYYGSGVIITKLLNKYGTERFSCELLESCQSEDELNQKEIYWIDKLNCLDKNIGYNLASGGSFGDSGYHQGMKGKSQSNYQKQQASIANSHPKSKQMKNKMSKALKGNHNASNGKGMKFIHKGDTQKRVKEENIPKYLLEGWVKGKSNKIRIAQQKAFKEKYANGKYITNGIDSKFVDNKDLENWLNQGWKLGKGPKNYINRAKHK